MAIVADEVDVAVLGVRRQHRLASSTPHLTAGLVSHTGSSTCQETDSRVFIPIPIHVEQDYVSPT